MHLPTLSSRLRWAIEQKLKTDPNVARITQSAVAKAAGVTPTAAGHWFADTNGINAEQARKVGAFLGVDPVWLESGQGDPHIAPLAQEILGIKKVVLFDDESPLHYRIPKVELRLRAGVTGFQTEPDRRDGGTMGIPKSWADRRGYNPDQLIGIDVKGESMEPTFYEGDTVIVNLADKRPQDNAVFAVNYDGEAVVKRLSRDAGQWWLLSDNLDQRKFYRRLCSGKECIIIGRVVRREGEHF